MMVMMVHFFCQVTYFWLVHYKLFYSFLKIDRPFFGALQEIDSYPHGSVLNSKSCHVRSPEMKPRCKRGDRG